MPRPHSLQPSVPRGLSALGAGLLLAVAVLSTVYRLGPLLLYPRLLIAMAGVVLLLRYPRLHALGTPLLLLLPVMLTAALMASVNDDWGHLSLFMTQLLRGIGVSYLCAIALAAALGLFKPLRATVLQQRIIHAVCIALLLQAVLSILQVVNPGFREAFLSFVNLAESWRQEADSGHFRYSGIGGISIYDTAIAYCVLAAALLLEGRDGRLSNVWLRAAALASLIALGLLHGRTGLLYGIALMIWLAARELVYHQAHQPLMSPRLLAILSAVGTGMYLILDEDLRNLILNFAGELFVNFFSGEGLRSDSTDDFFENHLHLPDLSTIIGGAAYWAQPELAEEKRQLYSTDSGVLLLLNYGGTPLLLSMVMSLLGMLYLLHAGIVRRAGGTHARGLSALSIYLSAIFVLVTWKGPIFFSEHCMTALFTIVIARAVIIRASAAEHSGASMPSLALRPFTKARS